MNLKTFKNIIGDGALAICLKFTINSKLSRNILFTLSIEEKCPVTDVTAFVTDVTLYEM